MVDLDQFVTKDVILINEKEVDALPVMAMKLFATLVVRGAEMVSKSSDSALRFRKSSREQKSKNG